MASLLLAWLLLQAPLAAAESGPGHPLKAIDLDAGALQGSPGLLAADTLALRLEARRAVDFKLSEQEGVLAAGRLLPGANSLRFTRPGLAQRSQTLTFQLELLENGAVTRKTIRIIVTVEGETDEGPQKKPELSGSFTLGMFHEGRLVGFRRKRLQEFLKLKTGPVAPVADPGLSGSAIRSQPSSSGISVLGLAMSLAKYLASKKAEKRLQARNAETLKKKLTVTLIRNEKEVPVTIELRIDKPDDSP